MDYWVDSNAPLPYPTDLYPNRTEEVMAEDWAGGGDEAWSTFHDRGYITIRDAYSPEQLAGVLDAFEALIAGSRPDFQGIQFEASAAEILPTLTPDQRQDAVRKLWKFVDFDARLHAIAHHSPLLSLLERMMGEAPELFQDMALFKPPHIGREKPWHQDHAYFALPLETPVVGVWIALDEATVENGCMCVLPGSHRKGPRPHFARRDWQLCDTDVERQDSVAIPLPPGGCLLFHGLLVHGTPANQSPHRRRAVQFHYKPASIPFGCDQNRLDVFGGEGTNVVC